MRLPILIIALLCAVSAQPAIVSIGCGSSVDAAGYTISTDGTLLCLAATASNDGSVDSITFWARDAGDGNDTVYVCVYDTTEDGKIGALLDRSDDSVIIAGDGAWVEYTLTIETGSIGNGERKFICIWAKGIAGQVRLDLCDDEGTDARREFYTDVNQVDTGVTRKYFFDNDNYWKNPGIGDGVNYGSDDTLKFGGIVANETYTLLEMDSTELVGLNDTLDNLADSVETDTVYARVLSFTGITDDDIIVRPMLISHNDDESDWEDYSNEGTWDTEGGRGADADYDASLSWIYHMSDTTSGGDFDIPIDGHADSVITGDVAFMWGYMIEINESPRNENVTLISSDEPLTTFDPYRQMVIWFVSESGLEDPSVGVTADTTNYGGNVILYFTTVGEATTDRHGANNRHGAIRH